MQYKILSIVLLLCVFSGCGHLRRKKHTPEPVYYPAAQYAPAYNRDDEAMEMQRHQLEIQEMQLMNQQMQTDDMDLMLMNQWWGQ